MNKRVSRSRRVINQDEGHGAVAFSFGFATPSTWPGAGSSPRLRDPVRISKIEWISFMSRTSYIRTHIFHVPPALDTSNTLGLAILINYLILTEPTISKKLVHIYWTNIYDVLIYYVIVIECIIFYWWCPGNIDSAYVTFSDFHIYYHKRQYVQEWNTIYDKFVFQILIW